MKRGTDKNKIKKTSYYSFDFLAKSDIKNKIMIEVFPNTVLLITKESKFNSTSINLVHKNEFDLIDNDFIIHNVKKNKK